MHSGPKERGKRRDLANSYHDRALGRLNSLPKYDVQCTQCKSMRVKQMSFEQYDQSVKGFQDTCLMCDQKTTHNIVLLVPPSVEYRGEGFTKNDWSEPLTKYQRDHFQESGTRTEEKAAERKRKRK